MGIRLEDVYLPRLAERSVLDQGITDVFSQMLWDHDGFAVAFGYDGSTGTYVGLAIPQENVPPQITNLTLLVQSDRALAQREQERAERDKVREHPGSPHTDGDHPGPDGDNRTGTGSAPPPPPPPPPPPGPKNTRFYGTVRLDPERFGRDINRLYQEVIQHLATPEGVELEITLEISARKKDGYPDDKARIVTENARTLKFDTYGFEDR